MKKNNNDLANTVFGNYNDSNYPKVAELEALLDKKVEKYANYGYPFFKCNNGLVFDEYLKDKKLNHNPLSVEKVLEDIASLTQNMPNWANPGTMINVIPPVNLIALASSNYIRGLNPNFAQDTYAGFSILSELEVVKYISDLLNWDYRESIGFFTFGGKATNLYATKIALAKCDEVTSRYGCERSQYFILTSANAHPCHYEVCDWLGLGSESCIEIPCLVDGRVDLVKTEEIIKTELEKGKIFLGCNLNGGSTNELYMDPIEELHHMIDRIVRDYKLSYRPHIHVDSVIGWVFLFFKEYDFANNSLKIDGDSLKKIEFASVSAKAFYYADSIGIDFHKTGFCPYVSSLFLCKARKDYYALSPEKYQSLQDIKYGNYNPYQTTLELTRSSEGAISALASLKSLGVGGFQQIYARMIEAADLFRKKLGEKTEICVVNDDSCWLATLFILKPKNYCKFDLKGLLGLDKNAQFIIKNYNAEFAKYVQTMARSNKTKLVFTSSRSHVIPGTDVSFGTLKAYPMSVFFDKETVKEIMQDFDVLLNNYVNSIERGIIINDDVVADDMVYRKRRTNDASKK